MWKHRIAATNSGFWTFHFNQKQNCETSPGVSMKKVEDKEWVYRGHRAMSDVFQVISSIVIYSSWGYVEILSLLA